MRSVNQYQSVKASQITSGTITNMDAVRRLMYQLHIVRHVVVVTPEIMKQIRTNINLDDRNIVCDVA